VSPFWKRSFDLFTNKLKFHKAELSGIESLLQVLIYKDIDIENC